MLVKIYVQANNKGNVSGPGSWIFRIVPEEGSLPEPSSGDAVKSEEVIKFEDDLKQYQALQEAAVAAFESYEDVLDLSDAIVITNNKNAVPGIREALGGGVTVRECDNIDEKNIVNSLLCLLPKQKKK
jgi:hypothetical protein